jgi:hypothetical protein
MDLHKPKPWHNVREFLKEYAIIVVGVLTALGAEQVVEIVHRHDAVAEARRALNAEVTFDLAVFDLTAFQVDCMDARLDELERWLHSWETGKPLPISGALPTPRTTNVRTSVWRVASAGALVQMPFEDRVAYGHLYDAFENNANIRREGWHDLWDDIDEHVGARSLSEDLRLRIGTDIRRLRKINAAITHNWSGFSQDAEKMGLKPPASTEKARDALASGPLCKTLLGA